MSRETVITLEKLEAPFAVVRVAGSVDSSNSDQLQTQLDEALDQGFDHLALDLRRLDFMSTAGWSTLVAALRRVRSRRGGMHLCGLSPEMAEVHQLLEFDKLIPAHPSLEDALSALRAGVAS